MKAVKITKERIEEILSVFPFVKDSVVISENSKRVLAAILDYFFTKDIVRDNDTLICSNDFLRSSAGIGKNSLIPSIQELLECNLINREVGKRRIKNEKSTASKYTVNWDNLQKPVVKENLFERFLRLKAKSPKTPMSPVDVDVDSGIESELGIGLDLGLDLGLESGLDKVLNNIINNIENDMVILNENDLNYFDYLNNNKNNNNADTSGECPHKEEKAVAEDNTIPSEKPDINNVFQSKEERRLALELRIKQLEQSKELQESFALRDKELEEQYQREYAEQYFKRWGTYPDGWNNSKSAEEDLPECLM